MAPIKIPTVKLNSGYDIPVFGLGTWKSSPQVMTQAIKEAIDFGYRHIDCALVYGNEADVGAGLEAKIKEGVVRREDLFLTSKVWNTFHSTDKVVSCLKKTLTSLCTDYVDLYLIHWPFGYQEGGELFPKNEKGETILSDVDFIDTWKGMEECVKLGLAKSIGLSNFNSEQIQRILDLGSIKPAMNQFECHPYLNQRKLIEFCKSKGILATAYSPLGSPDRPWAKPSDTKLLDDPKLIELAKKYGKSPAQIVLRWMIQRDVITIPKTVTPTRLQENMNVFDFALSTEDMDYVYSLDSKGRIVVLDWARGSPYYPFTVEF